MEETLEVYISTTQTVENRRQTSRNETYVDPLVIFNRILSEQESAEAFSAFVQSIQSYYSTQDWRDVLPFLQLASSRNLLSDEGYILPSRIQLSDFARINKSYFYSYDNNGRPFIAFVLNQEGKLSIRTIFFSNTVCNLPQAHKEHFRALAVLFLTGRCRIDYGKGQTTWILATPSDIKKALQKQD